jgi:putative endonuclease
VSPTPRELGNAAEDRAVHLLLQHGYRILERNVRIRGGEIDIIAADAGVVCFVEVRARKNAAYGRPEETIGPHKQRRLILAAQHWLARNRAGRCRFDAVVICAGEIRLIRDAFRL